MGDPVEEGIVVVHAEQVEEHAEFDFEAWSQEASLSRKTTVKLRQEDLCARRSQPCWTMLAFGSCPCHWELKVSSLCLCLCL